MENEQILMKSAAEARGLAIDAVHACSSGHLGLPLGCAEIGAVLWGGGGVMRFNPDVPKWINRDRFVLSAGHGSMFLYAWLHLSGYDLTLDQIRNFRQLHSGTPGHPESFETAGVECTTGPLGQGVGNAVGFAVSQKMAAARFNTAEHTVFDNHVVALFGDGCMQEGVTAESSSFAGHYGLDNLILIYDSNDVTLDAMAERTQSEDVGARFEAYGFDVVTIDGHDVGAVTTAMETARSNDNGRPKLIIAKTEIGRGIPEVAGTAKGHGESGANFADEAHRVLGLPEGETFYVSDEVRAYFDGLKERRIADFAEWQVEFEAWKKANPSLARELAGGLAKVVPTDLFDRIPEFDPESKLATRAAGGEVIQVVGDAMPMFFTGSADLFGSTKNYLKNGGDWGRKDYGARNIWFGIREHAMGAILNGVAYDGIFRGSGATFLVFADYCRPAIRLAALSRLPVLYIFTHDSVGVGEDGPTHQPVETVCSLRVMPQLDVIRPCDSEETAGAFVAGLERTDGPTALVLTRQGVPMLNTRSPKERRDGVIRGGYVIKPESGELTTILMASGSEVQLALVAAKTLGDGVRVVSMPCFERFDRQSESYQQEVLPASCARRVAIEAGVTGLWWKYTGLAGRVIGIDRFGISAPAGVVMKELGITAEAVVEAARELG